MFVPAGNCYVPPSWGDGCALMSLGILPASALPEVCRRDLVTFEVSAVAVTVALRNTTRGRLCSSGLASIVLLLAELNAGCSYV